MNELRLYRKKYSNNFDVYSTNNFFAEPVVCRIKEGVIEIAHPTLDCAKTIHYPNKYNNLYKFGISGVNLNDGIYKLDEEESNEDLLVFTQNN